MIRGQIVNVADLQPHPMNYNQHPAAQVIQLRESLKQFGQVRDIIVWRQYVVAGHGVLLAARAEGWTGISATRLPDDWAEGRVISYLAADNETARLSLTDEEQLAALLTAVSDDELKALAAGGEERLKALMGNSGEQPAGDAEPQTNRAGDYGYKIDRDGIRGRVLLSEKQHGIELVKRLKDNGEFLLDEVDFWCKIMAKMATESFDVVIPIPQRKPRDFHLATYMAQSIAKVLSIPFCSPLSQKIDDTFNVRYLPDKLSSDILFDYDGSLNGLNVLVVDDVVSTRRTAKSVADTISDANSLFFVFMYSAHG